MENRDIAYIKRKETEIVHQEARIEAAEERIVNEQEKILEAEHEILKQSKQSAGGSLFNSSLTPPERTLFRKRFLKRIIKHKLLFSVLVTCGIVLVWRGIWHAADALIWHGETMFPFNYLMSAIISFCIGIGILWLVNRYTDLTK